MHVGIIKGVVQLNGRALTSIEQLVKVLSPSILNLIVFHQKSICPILDAFDLVDIPHLSLTDFGHLIDVSFPFFRV
uniref:Uncharacterized protein n=1 Tax=Arundo donax TaxID=35708 RepID=A0A0A9DIR9_ARUDO